ncbi:MAG: 2-dehydropantoate 2-reductase [Anaerolineales bacterium]|nr:MAG: 2-dehydropantoate 2-reductase [Anaerolineales bacterium]
MRIAVVGAGAMGSLFGGKLSAVAEVTLLDPWAEHVTRMQRDGLGIVELDGSQTTVPVTATTDPAAVPTVDIAIIFVKAHATRQASQWASRFLAPDGLALTLQNGLGNADMMAQVLGSGRVVAGVTSHGATLLGPGQVRHAGKGPTHIATRTEIAVKLSDVASVFEQAGFEVHLSDDLESLVWGKLIVNVGINGLTAILRVPNGQLVEIPAASALMAQAVAEAEAVCQAKGVILPYDDPLSRVREVARATAANRSSMLQDVLRGVPTEIGVINEAIVREGKRLGVATPDNEFIVTTIRAIEDSYAVRVS